MADTMKSIDPGDMEPRAVYRLMISAIVPRPIAFISTISDSGLTNLAPFSFFTGVSSRPPIIAVSIVRGQDGEKDTMRNIRATREFVVNVVDRDLARPMAAASVAHPANVSEFDACDLTPVPSDKVKPPRVAESPVQFECVVTDLVERPGGADVVLVLGRILRFHVARRLWKDGDIDPVALDPVGRLGGKLYAMLDEPFAL